jgi:hypothetical protein
MFNHFCRKHWTLPVRTVLFQRVHCQSTSIYPEFISSRFLEHYGCIPIPDIGHRGAPSQLSSRVTLPLGSHFLVPSRGDIASSSAHDIWSWKRSSRMTLSEMTLSEMTLSEISRSASAKASAFVPNRRVRATVTRACSYHLIKAIAISGSSTTHYPGYVPEALVWRSRHPCS